MVDHVAGRMAEGGHAGDAGGDLAVVADEGELSASGRTFASKPSFPAPDQWSNSAWPVT